MAFSDRALGCLIVALCASTASAQEPGPPQKPAAVEQATRLFEEGKALREQGRLEAACERFEQSFKLVRGLGVQYQLARCYADVGRLASAHRSFRDIAEVAERTGQVERGRVARQRAAELEPRLIYLSVEVPAPTAGLVVFVDGKPWPRNQWGTPQPIDPGRHQILAVAPERSQWRSVVQASNEGQRWRVRVPTLAAAAKRDVQPRGLPAQAVAGVVIGSVGFAAVAAGVSIGVAAKVREGDAADVCDEAYCSTPEGLAIIDEARTLGNVATGLFITGAVLVGAGITIFFTAPSDDAASAVLISPMIDRGSVGVHVRAPL